MRQFPKSGPASMLVQPDKQISRGDNNPPWHLTLTMCSVHSIEARLALPNVPPACPGTAQPHPQRSRDP